MIIKVNCVLNFFTPSIAHFVSQHLANFGLIKWRAVFPSPHQALLTILRTTLSTFLQHNLSWASYFYVFSLYNFLSFGIAKRQLWWRKHWTAGISRPRFILKIPLWKGREPQLWSPVLSSVQWVLRTKGDRYSLWNSSNSSML